MSKTNYAGIDYGLGKTNIDNETSIRFGVIGQNSEGLGPEACEDIWSNGRNLSFEAFQAEAKDNLRSALSDYFSDHKWSDEKQSKLDRAVESAFEAIEDELNEQYEEDCDTYLYEQGGYSIQTDSHGDLIILKSPYFTHAQFCSPCFPGGGHLENPCETGPKTYCLGHDWFEGSKAPYPVFSVETGEQVNP